MSQDFWNKVQQKAYLKYINRMNVHVPEDSAEDWNESLREQSLESKIEEDAYSKYRAGYKDSDLNWLFAKQDVIERLQFLAFYLHERDIDKTPLENWIEAEKIYIENF